MTNQRIPLTLFGALTVGNLVSVAAGLVTLEWLTKPLLMPMLIVLVLVSGGLAHHHARLMVFGLATATIADVALLIDTDLAFLTGMGFFLVMQACYITVFVKLGAWDGVKRRRWLIPALLAFLAAFFIPLWGELGDFAVPMALYGLALAAMAMFAIGLSTRMGIGGVLFLLSDLLIGINVGGLDFPGRGIVIMSTYIAAQYLLISGWLRITAPTAERPVTPG